VAHAHQTYRRGAEKSNVSSARRVNIKRKITRGDGAQNGVNSSVYAAKSGARRSNDGVAAKNRRHQAT